MLRFTFTSMPSFRRPFAHAAALPRAVMGQQIERTCAQVTSST